MDVVGVIVITLAKPIQWNGGSDMIHVMRLHWLFPLLLTACGSSAIDNPGGNGDARTSSTDARPTDARAMCTTAYECTSPQVCNPANQSCAANLACTTHTMCGKQAYCQESHICAPNVLRGPCDTDDNCVGQERCEAGRCGCGGELLTATAVAPNMLLTVDRSNSMVTNDVPGTNGDSRWTVARRVLKSLTQQYQGGIRFGLALWPGNQKQCEGSNDQTNCHGLNQGVAMNTGTATMIGNYIDTATTCNLGTPIGRTLNTLVSYAPLGDSSRDNYVVLVTDGAETCQDAGTGAAAATLLRNRTPSVRTFVIGFGGDVSAATLNQIAMNGGTARPGGPPYYYQADNEAALEAAFDAIAGEVATCTYTLSSNPGDPTRIFVFLDDAQVPRDTAHANGWDYEAGPMRLTFYGAACTQVRGGGELSVSFGCAIIP